MKLSKEEIQFRVRKTVAFVNLTVEGYKDVAEYFGKLEEENEALRELATHKPGCHESGNECICGLDALLAGGKS